MIPELPRDTWRRNARKPLIRINRRIDTIGLLALIVTGLIPLVLILSAPVMGGN